jgi:hypothetical protein
MPKADSLRRANSSGRKSGNRSDLNCLNRYFSPTTRFWIILIILAQHLAGFAVNYFFSRCNKEPVTHTAATDPYSQTAKASGTFPFILFPWVVIDTSIYITTCKMNPQILPLLLPINSYCCSTLYYIHIPLRKLVHKIYNVNQPL